MWPPCLLYNILMVPCKIVRLEAEQIGGKEKKGQLYVREHRIGNISRRIDPIREDSQSSCNGFNIHVGILGFQW